MADHLGALPHSDGTAFRVWAPDAKKIELCIEGMSPSLLSATGSGYHEGAVKRAGPGTHYQYRVDGRGPFPDPASRFQPLGVHGPSEVIDWAAYRWGDGDWPGVKTADLVIYELHIGTFSEKGSFAAAVEKLEHVKNLGASAIQIMPVADFAGDRNWGYDGVSLFAPARCYGRPDELRYLVDTAHQLGLGVIFDVVYNHLGPDGNYLREFSRSYFTNRHPTPWGDAVNYDSDGNAGVRDFILKNAEHWIREYHGDGLRLDATHAIFDDGPYNILAEIAAHTRRCADRPIVIIAEDERNLDKIVRSVNDGGYGFDAVFSDDFHHQIRRRLAGDKDGYYADYSGSTPDIAQTIQNGWFYNGQRSPVTGKTRGTDSSGITSEHFIYCVQNHDQIGNRAMGERLHHQIEPAAYRAAIALLILAPETPFLFQGQEWGASSPFLYFTDHNDELGRLVTEGRRKEFARFEAFADPAARERIPDPQSKVTFSKSRLRWEELAIESHAAIVRLHNALLRLRRSEVVPRRHALSAKAIDSSSLFLSYDDILVVAHLQGVGQITIDGDGNKMELLLSTETSDFAVDSTPIDIRPSRDSIVLEFGRPGAVVLRLPR